MTRFLPLLALLAACDDETAACALFEANAACPECSDGEATCTFDGVAETRNSCGGCQARAALYGTLCSQGSTATAAEIEAGTVCETEPLTP